MNEDKLEKELERVDFWTQLKKNLPVIVVICGIIVAYTTMSISVRNLEDRVVKIEAAQVVTDKTIADINTNLAKISTSLEFIKEAISKYTLK